MTAKRFRQNAKLNTDSLAGPRLEARMLGSVGATNSNQVASAICISHYAPHPPRMSRTRWAISRFLF